MSKALQKDILKTATKHWKYLSPLLQYPKSNREYDLLVKRLDNLLDIVGENEDHILMGLIDLISNIISTYDEKHFQIQGTKGINALKFLMDSHRLTQSDLHEIGSQGVVSEILNHKRQLNIRQIIKLSKLFKVSPATFIDEKIYK